MAEQTLIERLTAAKEGSRELSDEALLACGWLGDSTESQDPTRSIDDAVRWVVPEGKNWIIWSDGEAMIYGDERATESWQAATPALALCIAALKARELGKP